MEAALSRAAILSAEREAEAIKLVYRAIHEGDPTNALIAIKYMDALKEMAKGDANKVFLPYEAPGVLGSIAGIKEILTERRKESESKKV